MIGMLAHLCQQLPQDRLHLPYTSSAGTTNTFITLLLTSAAYVILSFTDRIRALTSSALLNELKYPGRT